MAYRGRTGANKIQKGIAEAITGIVLGTLLIIIVNSFAQDGTLPTYFVWVFGLLIFIANLASLNYLRVAGLWYSIGWLIGSLLIISLLSPLDIVFNIAGPIVIIGLRAWVWIKNSSSD
jgi:hypothetical protein